MSINTTVNKQVFSGDGSTEIWPVTDFKVFAATEIRCIIKNPTAGTIAGLAAGASVELTYAVDFTVALTTTGVLPPYAPTVTIINTTYDDLAVGLKLTVLRNLPQTQLVNMRDNQGTPAATFEQVFDRAVMLIQQLQEILNRVPSFDFFSVSSAPSMEDPEEGKALIWNGSGNIVNSDTDFEDVVTAAAASAAAAAASESAAASSASAAATSATNASNSATAASASATAAQTAETNAETAETNAETAETNAETAQAAAEAAQTAAEAAQAAAETAETNAETAETNAETAETNAETAASNAATSETNAAASAVAAAASAAKLTGTSTSSVAIATGSKSFTTQSGKFFDVGNWLLITSDADPTNFMHGQVTAYSGTSLTVNVTNVGGSGTHADWTIRVSGTRGATGPAIDFSNITETIVMNAKAINEAKGSDIASATTTDIGAATGNFVDVTGTTTITGLGTVQAGVRRVVRFTGILTLTHHATSLILPTGANITTAAGDTAEFFSLGSGNWVCASYQRKSGQPLAGGLQVKVGSFTRDLTTASGTQAITGVGFTPKAVLFLGVRDGGLLDTKGVDTLAAANCILQGYDSNQFLGAAYSIYFYHGSEVDRQRALITTLGADGFTLTWTKDGSPTGTGTVVYLAIG